MKLNSDIKYILSILQRYGKGYIVGGYVRDYLLGIEAKDCDFVTNIEYDLLLEIFSEYMPKEIGKFFGIVQIKYNGKYYEIAKLRIDLGTPEDRKKQVIAFTDEIEEDLKRRDFTVNAIAYDGEKFIYGEGSRESIEKRELKFIGDVATRIKEDPLRILRAFRFIATKKLKPNINFDIIRENRALLYKISLERIKNEIVSIFQEKELVAFGYLNDCNLLPVIFKTEDYNFTKVNDSMFNELLIMDSYMERIKYILEEIFKEKYLSEELDKKIIFHLKELKYSKKEIKMVYNNYRKI